MLDEETQNERVQEVVDVLGWTGPVFVISALANTGTQALIQAIMIQLEDWRDAERLDPDLAQREADIQLALQAEARAKIESTRVRAESSDDDDDDYDDDDYDVEVEYVQ